MKIKSIIFSKDRASQLHLLLSSLEKNAPGLFDLNVLYTHSNEEFKKGYDKLIELCKSNNWEVNFIKESSFKQDVMTQFDQAYLYTCFLTDDDVLFEKPDLETIEKSLKNDAVICFSLRLGFNTTFCYTMGQQNKLVVSQETENTIIFDWQKSYMDFGYPLSVDGHVFRTKDISKLSKALNFVNPNTYEAALQVYETFPRNMMESYKQSKLVGIPVNVVQNVYPNKQGEKFGISAKELNDKFLKNEFIDLNSLDFSSVIGCHQEIEYKFLKQVYA